MFLIEAEKRLSAFYLNPIRPEGGPFCPTLKSKLIANDWEYQIKYQMVFQIEGICINYNNQNNVSLSNFFGNLNFPKLSKYTPGPIELRMNFT